MTNVTGIGLAYMGKKVHFMLLEGEGDSAVYSGTVIGTTSSGDLYVDCEFGHGVHGIVSIELDQLVGNFQAHQQAHIPFDLGEKFPNMIDTQGVRL